MICSCSAPPTASWEKVRPSQSRRPEDTRRLVCAACLSAFAAGHMAGDLQTHVNSVGQSSLTGYFDACPVLPGQDPAIMEVRAATIRDIFGNPFRPVSFSDHWRADTAVSLARQMYESREFSAMPILADALQDAGCDDAGVLDHCRDPKQVHVRGCWVVDLVLGKE
jgi:hypothetical protein